MKDQGKKTRLRISFCLICFTMAFLSLSVRAWQLQYSSDHRLSKIRNRQTAHRKVLSPQRGTMFDQKGRTLALSLKVPSVFADPKMVENPHRFAQLLGRVLKIDRRKILKKLKNKNRRFVWIKRKLDPAMDKELRSLKLPGLHVVHEGMRLYPEKKTAAQVIGYVGIDGEGLEGIERHYDSFLRNQKLVVLGEHDARGRSLYLGPTQLMEPEPGADLYLSIDSIIQHTVEQELEVAAREVDAKRAMGVVMDPSTGQVYAMASYPYVNINKLTRSSIRKLRNQPIQDVFEPGSTFKPFTLAAALEAKTLVPQDIIFTKKASLKVNGKVIRTQFDHPWLSPRGILKFSNNIGSSRVALELGSQRFHEAIRNYGFGRRVRIDFPGEASGLLSNPNRWEDVDTANISFGQGIGVTGIQLTAALAAIANKGLSVNPYLVDRVVFNDGREMKVQKKGVRRRLFSEQTAKSLTSWMEAVTEEDGTGSLAAIDGYRVAGKSGTTQKIDPVTKRYSREKVVSSFAGFAPASNPKVVAFFAFDEPQGTAHFGGQIAAPVFREVVAATLQYLDVPPDQPQNIPSLVAQMIDEPQVVEPVEEDLSEVPNLEGLTVREVLVRAQQIGMNVKVSGTGLAVRQRPKAGSPIKNSKNLRVHFKPELKPRIDA